jgi:hypothetical protein
MQERQERPGCVYIDVLQGFSGQSRAKSARLTVDLGLWERGNETMESWDERGW